MQSCPVDNKHTHLATNMLIQTASSAESGTHFHFLWGKLFKVELTRPMRSKWFLGYFIFIVLMGLLIISASFFLAVGCGDVEFQ